ncbi:hypothetical protein DM47_2185 [Burkholderia mallei]|nr:hypothetical protein DM46_1687 [Burkholderia mallei]KOS90405.1 hypothetical protein DM53_4169 [Burkholderia mallei]KOS92249.1 hypothetical protein DM45_2955 [Burkholderia mallei]KOT08323.1 hypothetical protein DM77_2415 [Burkholderia mallei]KOT18008.1 hypothetical protein DM47_2185 [Burkholderia mallei]
MRNGVTRHTSDAEVIQLPQPATRGKREGTDGKCILATLSKNDRRGKSLKALSGPGWNRKKLQEPRQIRH